MKPCARTSSSNLRPPIWGSPDSPVGSLVRLCQAFPAIVADVESTHVPVGLVVGVPIGTEAIRALIAAQPVAVNPALLGEPTDVARRVHARHAAPPAPGMIEPGALGGPMGSTFRAGLWPRLADQPPPAFPLAAAAPPSGPSRGRAGAAIAGLVRRPSREVCSASLLLRLGLVLGQALVLGCPGARLPAHRFLLCFQCDQPPASGPALILRCAAPVLHASGVEPELDDLAGARLHSAHRLPHIRH